MLITNAEKGNTLLERLEQLIAGSDEMRVLVGFFYFWGVEWLHKGLSEAKDFKLRILVGLEAEDHCGKIVEFAAEEAAAGDSDAVRREAFLRGLRTVMRGRELDMESYHRRVGLFLDLLKTGKIELRKTREPNHSKLYHVTLKKDVAKILGKDHCWITGSSNLTRPGLKEQHELNVQLVDFGGEETKEFFDKLWESAVPLTDDEKTKTAIIEAIEGEKSILAPLTPFEAYALMLKKYLDCRDLVDKTNAIARALAEPRNVFDRDKPKYRTYTYQVDAINQALSILEQHNGVIVADVVGLGKSVVGSVLGRVSGLRGIVVAPPGLVGDKTEGTGWWGYLQDFGLDAKGWEVMSRGKLEAVLERMKNADQGGAGNRFDLVIADEAHYFRNQDSEDYHYMSQVCRGRQVVLMTATPFSNRPADMLSLVKLFSPGRSSTLVVDGNLTGRFARYSRLYRAMDRSIRFLKKAALTAKERTRLEKMLAQLELNGDLDTPEGRRALLGKVQKKLKKLAQEIRQVLAPVMIRRNRLDLRKDPDYREEIGAVLPTVHDPQEQFFALSPEQSAFYDRVIRDYFGEDSAYKGAMYQPFNYLEKAKSGDDDDDDDDGDGGPNVQQINMFKFIRRMLVRRFESSFGAFAKSVDNFLSIHQTVLELSRPQPFGKNVVVLNRTLMDRLLDMEGADDDEVDGVLKEYEEQMKGKYGASRNMQIYHVREDFGEAKASQFEADLKADINLFRSLREEILRLNLLQQDPKAAEMVAILASVLNGTHEKIACRNKEPARKVLIFTEFQDTVDHLRGYLDVAFPGKVLTVRTLSAAMDQTIRRNFDGSVGKSMQEDQFQILLATDKMSEGFNLNRAGLVVNYDITWNPTRIIQRLGRINRIGTKVFEDLYLFNFFPTEQGAGHNNVREIAMRKMFMIHTSIGEDSKIFAVDEEPTPAELYERIGKNPEDAATAGILTRVKLEWERICKRHPEMVKKLDHFAPGVKTVQYKKPPAIYALIRRGGSLFIHKHVQSGKDAEGKPAWTREDLGIEAAMEALRCRPESKRCRDFSSLFWARYAEIRSAIQISGQETVDSGDTHGTSSFAWRAKSVLETAAREGIGGEFVGVLLEDMMFYGTLADRTLRLMASSWEDGKADQPRFLEIIGTLRREMGQDYLQSVKRLLKRTSPELVLTVEHKYGEKEKESDSQEELAVVPETEIVSREYKRVAVGQDEAIAGLHTRYVVRLDDGSEQEVYGVYVRDNGDYGDVSGLVFRRDQIVARMQETYDS